MTSGALCISGEENDIEKEEDNIWETIPNVKSKQTASKRIHKECDNNQTDLHNSSSIDLSVSKRKRKQCKDRDK